MLFRRQVQLLKAQRAVRAEMAELQASCGLPVLQDYPPYLLSMIVAIAELRCGVKCAYLEDLPGNIKVSLSTLLMVTVS